MEILIHWTTLKRNHVSQETQAVVFETNPQVGEMYLKDKHRQTVILLPKCLLSKSVHPFNCVCTVSPPPPPPSVVSRAELRLWLGIAEITGRGEG